VLHTALRAKADAIVNVNGQNVIPEIYEVKKDEIIFIFSYFWKEKRYTGKQFTDIVISELGL
jgi:glucose-6-phosphate isomerase